MSPKTIAVFNGTARTFQHLIPQALAKGHRVRAIVRSASRFQSSTEKHSHLSAHEWRDTSDLPTLAKILEGVDVLYVAMAASGKALFSPSWLNSDAVASICTVLHDRISPGCRSPTKLVILVAIPARPGEPRHNIAESVIGHQYNDLRAAQRYLSKQDSWLDVVYLCPGMILDSEASNEPAVADAVTLKEGVQPPLAISYTRLAGAMLLCSEAEGEAFRGKFAVPVPTSRVPSGVQHMGPQFSLLGTVLRYRVVPFVAKAVVWGVGCAAVGYAYAVRGRGTAVGSWLGME